MIARPSRALLWPSAREPVPRSISCSLRAPACLFEARLQPESTIPRHSASRKGLDRPLPRAVGSAEGAEIDDVAGNPCAACSAPPAVVEAPTMQLS